MSSNKYKVIWDAVHGQIEVSNAICNHILDNQYFQRLKRLEQTNTRPLYPCAHHDRFIHSLGTYHLGKKVFDSIFLNSEKYIAEHANELDVDPLKFWEKLKSEFELACLLHDVGHAPFSHTFEKFYDVDVLSKNPKFLDSYLLNKDSVINYQDIDNHLGSLNLFQADYCKVINSSASGPSQHEKVSAFLVLTKFSKTLNESFDSDPFNIARMILGVKFESAYNNPKAIKEQIYNCFIELLNGSEIDVDKIDYLVRDQWATGNVFKNIDYNRLLSSAYIIPNKQRNTLSLCFHKKAINELIGIQEAKHTLVSNIHNHPVVKYDDFLLQKAVNQSVKIELKSSAENPDEETLENYVANIVSVKALMEPVEFANSKIYLPTDDDLIHYLKKNYHDSAYAEEWLSRSYRLKALWKSPFDFNHIFAEFTDFEHRAFYKNIEQFTKEYIEKCTYIKDDSLSKYYYIHKKGINNFSVFKLTSDLDILLNKYKQETAKLTDLLSSDKEGNSKKENHRKYFLLYLANPYVNKSKNREINKERDEFILYVKSKVREYFEHLTNEIIDVLNDFPESKIYEIKDKFREFKTLNDDNDKIDFEQTLLLFFTHLDKGNVIEHVKEMDKAGIDITTINPKKRKYKNKAEAIVT